MQLKVSYVKEFSTNIFIFKFLFPLNQWMILNKQFIELKVELTLNTKSLLTKLNDTENQKQNQINYKRNR